jgi:hypothetical protein
LPVVPAGGNEKGIEMAKGQMKKTKEAKKPKKDKAVKAVSSTSAPPVPSTRAKKPS